MAAERRTHPRRVSPTLLAALLAAVLTAAILIARQSGGVAIDEPWIPAWDVRAAFDLDGLAVLYGLLATGIGTLVFAYAGAHMPLHLARQGRALREEQRFAAAMVLFMVAMVGLATAQDLIFLFVFWDITAIASYLLIGFDRERVSARRAALMALIVTGVSAVLLLIAILLLRSEYGTTSIPVILDQARSGSVVVVACGLIAVAGLAKSAQVPLHFWLPRAMAAPTPVSAYLHSAAMVAAGVFLLSRLHPLFALSQAMLDVLLVVGLVTIAVGGLLALAADELKQILAYSTISQYGYVVVALGIGGAAGAAAACFYVIAHAIAKSALFLTSGAVSEATGHHRLTELGGLRRSMPVLAVAAAVAAATIAALPLTLGFFKDELFFKAALEQSDAMALLAVACAAVTVAYMARFWLGIFGGPPRVAAMPIPALLIAPVVILALLALAGGVFVEPFAALAADAASDTAARPVTVEAAYHLDTRSENVMALGAYVAGLLLLAARLWLTPALAALRSLGQRMGPERLYDATLTTLDRVSFRLHDIEVRDLRTRVVAVLVPAAGLVVIGLLATPSAGTYRAGTIAIDDLPLAVTLGVSALAAVATCVPRRHLALVLSLSAVGFSLAVVYALLDAPDVALVAVLIETIFALLFLGVFALVPRNVLRREASLRSPRRTRRRDAAVASASGIVVFLVAWGALSRPTPQEGMAERHLELTPAAHAKDTVTAILADFRGLDTLVEITVVSVALLGVLTLLRRTATR